EHDVAFLLVEAAAVRGSVEVPDLEGHERVRRVERERRRLGMGGGNEAEGGDGGQQRTVGILHGGSSNGAVRMGNQRSGAAKGHRLPRRRSGPDEKSRARAQSGATPERAILNFTRTSLARSEVSAHSPSPILKSLRLIANWPVAVVTPPACATAIGTVTSLAV